jgi:hypothetical protein
VFNQGIGTQPNVGEDIELLQNSCLTGVPIGATGSLLDTDLQSELLLTRSEALNGLREKAVESYVKPSA